MSRNTRRATGKDGFSDRSLSNKGSKELRRRKSNSSRFLLAENLYVDHTFLIPSS